MTITASIISIVVALVILYVIYQVVSFLLIPALIVIAVGFIIYKFSGHNIFTGKNKEDEEKK